MLTDIQQKLLQMTKEIDELCRANGIHYSLGGGTAIGAIRHRGFLPWDDDIDLYMTRDNWEKFKALEKAGDLPANRVIESAETDDRYTNTMGRYVATDSSSVHSHQIIGSDPAGHVIDIFVFDRLHYDNYKRCLEDMMLFADLMDESKSYSSRLDMNLDRYPAALRRAKAEGRQPVVDELIDSFTHMDAPGSEHYIMEWGTAPFLFPADIFDDGYVRVPFEDTTLEIVRNYTEYLIWQYGFEWEYVPEHSEREGHEALFSNKIPYTKVREDYLPFIDVEGLRAAYLRKKKRLLKANPHRRDAEKAEKEKKAKACADALQSRLATGGAEDSYEDYYELQLSPEFAGRRDKHSKLRAYMYPHRIEIPEENAVEAVKNLMRTERMGKALRLIGIYTGDFEENLSAYRYDSEKLNDLREELIKTGELMNMATACDDMSAVMEELSLACDTYPENTRLMRLKLSLLLKEEKRSDETEAEIQSLLDKLFDTIPKDSPAYGEILKYKADFEGAGSDTYRAIFAGSRNGCVRMAINDILSARGEEPEADPDEAGADVAPAADAAAVKSGGKASLYAIARGLYRKVAGRDDRIKERAWEVALRTGDRMRLLEEYEDRIPYLESLLSEGRWEELRKEMMAHEEAVRRNCSAGLGLCVHPALSGIQYELFRHFGEGDLADKIDELVPEKHRTPIA